MKVAGINIPISHRTKRKFLIWRRRFWANGHTSIHFLFHPEDVYEETVADILHNIYLLMSLGCPIQVSELREKRTNDIQMILILSDKGKPTLRIIHRKSLANGQERTTLHWLLSY